MQKQKKIPTLEIDQNQLGNGLPDTATARVLTRLARFSSMEESKISQTLLFAANQYCGIRLNAGPFQARWKFEDAAIQITRGQQIIDQIDFQDGIRKAA